MSKRQPLRDKRIRPRGGCQATADLVEQYLASKKAKGLSPNTLETARIHLRRFAAYTPTLPQTPEQIERFLSTIAGHTYRWNHFRTLRTFYRWLERRARVWNPIPLIEAPRKPDDEPYYLDEEETVRLLLHPSHSQRDRTLLFLLVDTGMRIGEAVSITPASIRHDCIIVNGKKGPRVVPCHPSVPQMVRLLASSCPHGATIWCGTRGRLTIHGLKRAVRMAFRRAGFEGPRMSAHRLRHTFATIWNWPDAEGMAIGGWTTHDIWSRYHYVRERRVIEAHLRYSPISQLSKRLEIGQRESQNGGGATRKDDFVIAQGKLPMDT